MYFDLDLMLNAEPDLESLQEPFSLEEIDAIVRNLPLGKSLGPDGFNSDFMKKCRSVISRDFYELCQGFFHNNICLQSINGSYIVLV
jgi:hypothetical protein